MTKFIRVAFVLLFAWAARAEAAPAWTEFPLPEGSGPHDVAPAPDGTVWFTAQAAGALGRLDPAFGPCGRVPPRQRLGAARRHRGPGWRALGDRWWSQRDPARRSGLARDPRVSPPRQPDPAQISTPPPSTSQASSGSPARAASTVGWTRRRMRCASGTHRAARAPMASPPHPTVRSTSRLWPAATSRASIPPPAWQQ